METNYGNSFPRENVHPGNDFYHVPTKATYEFIGGDPKDTGNWKLIPTKDDTEERDDKGSVRCASTANIAIATALINDLTIDGVVVKTGDRVLLKNQTEAKENGIYIVVASGAALRADDASTSLKVTSGMTVFISEGTTSAKCEFMLTTAQPITLGTTALAFIQRAGAGRITKTFAWDVAELADGAGVTSDAIAVPGAVLGDAVIVGATVSTA